MRRVVSIIPIILVAGCGYFGGSVDKIPVPSVLDIVTSEDLKRGIVAVHELYVETMTDLGIAHETQSITPEQARNIQGWSEQYVSTKDRLARLVTLWETAEANPNIQNRSEFELGSEARSRYEELLTILFQIQTEGAR